MKWIRRNLVFLIGLLVAVGLMGAGGWYCYSAYKQEVDSAQNIKDGYDTLRSLINKNPNPGRNGVGEVDNVKTAQDQRDAELELARKLRAGFQPVETPAVSANFQAQLDGSVSELSSAAKAAGVLLPAGYYFTFQTESKMVNLPPKNYPELATRLGEIKALCDILFAARINSLESLQRPIVSGLETDGPDFVAPNLMTNSASSSSLAELTPYRVTFHCFSGELAAVLAGLASSPHGFIVKYLDVDPGSAGQPDVKVLPPKLPNERVDFLKENLLGVTLVIDLVKPKPAK